MNESKLYERFSNRQADYAKYRPTYPRELLDRLAVRIDLSCDREVADIGAGTGIFTALLLERQLRVHAVEPNSDMLGVARETLSQREGFVAVIGTAEATTLPSASVDVIFCAQAFHWFNTLATRTEWQRILRPYGYAVLVWNNPDLEEKLDREYQDLIRNFATDDGAAMRASRETQSNNVLFAGHESERIVLRNSQTLDYAGLVGRTESASFAPKKNDSRFAPLMDGLRRFFDAHQSNGQIVLQYETVVIFGQLEHGMAPK